VICNRTLKPDPQRIEAILNYPPLRNQKQLRKFLGLCKFHQQFIVSYAEYVAPLLSLLRKGNKWIWTSTFQSTFECLREKFANSIHLVQPDVSRDYIINSDASKVVIAAVLMQNDQAGNTNIVSTASRVLTQTEQRYTTCELELLAIVFALHRFRRYIYGHKVILNTDNKALTFLQKCVVTSNRVARWVMEIEQYDVEIRHIRGVDNGLADLFSRNPAQLSATEISKLKNPDQNMVQSIQLGIDDSVKRELKKLATLQDTDPRIQSIKESLQSHSTGGTKHILNNGVLYCKGDREGLIWKAMLPECLERKVMRFVHTSLGHLGNDKCYAEIHHVFHLKNFARKLRKFIATCDVCQRTKHLNRAYNVEENHHLPKRPGELCAVDIYGSLPTSRGNVRYIFVCYDVFSKYVKLYPLKSATTKACLNKLQNHYFVNVVKPRMILSDNGSQFRSPLWQTKLEENDVTTRFSPIRHPQSNPSERVMRELSKFFRIYCHNNHKRWAELIPHIEEWLNKTVASSTGYSPVELMFGDKRPGIFEKLLPQLKENMAGTEALEAKLERAFARIRRKAAERDRRGKKGNTNWNPCVNDRALVRSQNQSDAVNGVIDKFMHLYAGPYTTNRILPHSTYELVDDQGKLRGEFNKKQLRPYKTEGC
jgi:hypothetical protein